MKKRLLQAAIAAALTVAFAVPAFANPFADVPAKHWAYDAVNKLAEAGVVEGYGDGTFKGDKTMTRYEMAQIVAKAMNKNLNADQQATVDQLSQEFASELNTLGVRVETLENKMEDMTKLSGDARVRYGDVQDGVSGLDYRARFGVDGKINDNIKFNARLTTGNINAKEDNSSTSIALDTANVGFHAIGLDNTIGRQDIFLGSGAIMDGTLNGIASQVGGLTVFAGNTKEDDRVYAAEYGTEILGTKLTADFLKNDTTDEKQYGANAEFGVGKNVSANVEYVKNDTTGADAKAYGIKLNKLGLSATYRDAEAGAFTSYSTLNEGLVDFDATGAIKGMEYQYDKDLDKNVNLNVKYQDFDNMAHRTAATVSVKF
ncbi:hypothetical protein P22_0585 [Propionispora sp. 2/2-37]|uniref:S-layer homology domain-containing protein n=1 Tax=Propionispora sp. 2/2-37 TaxID=1677858 RepID=UPI0006BB63E9|nr:S-layer homology domain-containing protein [Propionispora sp. 2/2-37]CUH94519.1 hypothetical protein P22_0585 [Propionispora sp. 2/2-37]